MDRPPKQPLVYWNCACVLLEWQKWFCPWKCPFYTQVNSTHKATTAEFGIADS